MTAAARAEPTRSLAHGRSCGLHIGLPKTGTKTLQWNLFARHSQIDYLGMYIGEIASRPHVVERCRDRPVFEMMQELLFDGRRRPDLERCKRLYAEQVEAAFDAGRMPVWSWESLTTGSFLDNWVRAENLRKVLGPCRVMISIREPLALIESAYFQMLKRENVSRPFRRSRGGRPLEYITIDQWCEREFGGEIAPHLDYARIIKLYREIFGEEAVRVWAYEDMARDSAQYVSEICEHLGIDVGEGVSLTEAKRENRRWSRAQLRNLERIRDSRVRSLIFRFTYNRDRHRVLGFETGHPLAEGPPARALLSDVWRQRVVDATREGNRWLVEEYGLDLEGHGYPL